MFTSPPTYFRYRVLELLSPMLRGEDVYALQTALRDLGLDTGVLDGILGARTGAAIESAQSKLKITIDGKAGGGTQTAIAKRLADQARTKNNLPKGLVFGQVSHESSCRLGNYSDTRPDKSWDVGVAQRNSAHYDVKESFDVPFVIAFLGAYLRKYYDLFVGVTPDRRRWTLASGAWNAPAFAEYIAREEGAHVKDVRAPSGADRAKLEAYMASTTAFMIL